MSWEDRAYDLGERAYDGAVPLIVALGGLILAALCAALGG